MRMFLVDAFNNAGGKGSAKGTTSRNIDCFPGGVCFCIVSWNPCRGEGFRLSREHETILDITDLLEF